MPAESPVGTWDLFISAFNPSDRVSLMYGRVQATHKIWLIHPEYDLAPNELPKLGQRYDPGTRREVEFFQDFRAALPISDLKGCRISIDITGFMRPHMLFLINWLERNGVRQVDVFYSEPISYSDGEETQFSKGSIEGVRQVAGYEGIANRDDSNDLLIIGVGYDDRLIAEVAESKDKATKVQIYGLPPLRAHMYQENVIRAHRAADAVGDQSNRRRYYAPANDPFVTASVLSELVERESKRATITNLYLSPLATKPQALGFGLFFLGERKKSNTSIIFPYSKGYEKDTGVGLARTWQYTIEFPLAI